MLPVEDAPGYRVLDQAGQGGFAVVYRAYQERLDRVVALKVLSVDRVDQRTMRRFQRELQLTGRLTGHPNVVTVFDTGVTSSGKPYIAMDFFEHGSLRDKVRKEGPLPVLEVLRAGVKLAGALAAVHDAGVLHGDIKPQNILISRYGEPAIADFGVARVVDAAEISATSQAFTPLHAAPEVLTGQPHSVASDLYSLGSTLYHLLAGRPAFHNPDDPSIAPLMYRVLSLDPPPINRPDLPPAVFETVLRAMSKQPGTRYASARELARRLQAVQAELGLPVTDLIGQDAGTPATPAPGPHHPHTPATQPPGPHSYAPATQPPGPHSYPPATQPPGPSADVPARRPEVAYQQDAGGVGPVATVRPDSRGGSGGRRGILIGVAAVAVHLSLRPPATGAAQPAQTPAAQDTSAPSGRQDTSALVPRQVKVTADRGVVVELRWSLPAAARRHPVVLQRSPGEKEQHTLTALGQGVTSTRVAGLDRERGYCFLVGVPLEISRSSVVAWSKPACIRGAVAASTQ
ncbi:serine/threonine-protein kinase [Nonomuraea candida]|uniref:serine/threonine-protein kinase n=1 Tax=Nonomuraea candida TaxID=359159 RepID=UPI0006946FB5|nr:serine/threonine-protein kinase [Nonomuraea candida]